MELVTKVVICTKHYNSTHKLLSTLNIYFFDKTSGIRDQIIVYDNI